MTTNPKVASNRKTGEVQSDAGKETLKAAYKDAAAAILEESKGETKELHGSSILQR